MTSLCIYYIYTYKKMTKLEYNTMISCQICNMTVLQLYIIWLYCKLNYTGCPKFPGKFQI